MTVRGARVRHGSGDYEWVADEGAQAAVLSTATACALDIRDGWTPPASTIAGSGRIVFAVDDAQALSALVDEHADNLLHAGARPTRDREDSLALWFAQQDCGIGYSVLAFDDLLVRDGLAMQLRGPSVQWSAQALHRLGFGDVADTRLSAAEVAAIEAALDGLDRLFDRDDDPPAVSRCDVP